MSSMWRRAASTRDAGKAAASRVWRRVHRRTIMSSSDGMRPPPALSAETLEAEKRASALMRSRMWSSRSGGSHLGALTVSAWARSRRRSVSRRERWRWASRLAFCACFSTSSCSSASSSWRSNSSGLSGFSAGGGGGWVVDGGASSPVEVQGGHRRCWAWRAFRRIRGAAWRQSRSWRSPGRGWQRASSSSWPQPWLDPRRRRPLPGTTQDRTMGRRWTGADGDCLVCRKAACDDE